jgi:hypothetical protein
MDAGQAHSIPEQLAADQAGLNITQKRQSWY